MITRAQVDGSFGACRSPPSDHRPSASPAGVRARASKEAQGGLGRGGPGDPTQLFRAALLNNGGSLKVRVGSDQIWNFRNGRKIKHDFAIQMIL